MHRLYALPVLVAVLLGVTLPEDGPVPMPKPEPAPQATQSAPVPASKPAGDEVGTPSSDVSETRNAAPAKQPTGDAEKTAEKPAITAPDADEVALAHCEAELRKLGAVFEREEPLRGENGCGIEAPYRLDQIIRNVALSPSSQMRCETALALAQWTDTVVVPAAEALPEKITLTGISHGSTYICRRRNNSATGKMSQHAIGNAVDVMSFEFKGHDPIPVSPRAGDGTVEEAFQRAVRGGACLHFTTVLGPGTNASHADHLHLDVIKRRGGYRLCE
ncbi:MAG: extensin-like domain-containing protein [Hoeflea sp.]|uniref:extensin-like domain-containing protein n=1 Tax=Hoeflea sp. TaxID=1940281 RepID=UPI003EF2D184